MTRRVRVFAPTVPADALAGILDPRAAGLARRAGFSLDGFETFTGETLTDGGTALLTFGPAPSGRVWLVSRYLVAIQAAAGGSAPGSSCSVFIGDTVLADLVDGTSRGDLDVGSGDPPLIVAGGDEIHFLWAEAGTGNTALAKLQVTVGRLGGG